MKRLSIERFAKSKKVYPAALLWGFAEATLFFLVPDILLSLAGIKNLKKGYLALLCSMAGALLGGSLMYYLGYLNPQQTLNMLENIPAIDHNLIAKVADELKEHGIISMFFGPLSGTPYKIYAVLSPVSGIGYLLFALISIPARGIRFLAVTTIFHYFFKLFFSGCSYKTKIYISLVFWILFYIFYFSVMP